MLFPAMADRPAVGRIVILVGCLLVAMASGWTTAVSPEKVTQQGGDGEGRLGNSSPGRVPATAGVSHGKDLLRFEKKGDWPLIVPGRPARSRLSVPILMYHRVAPRSTTTNAVSRDLTVTPRAFRRQMAWLDRNGYNPITQAQLFRALYFGAELPKRPVVITFDDGYVDAVKTVLPVLAKRKWPATFYVITSRMGKPTFLNWKQLRRLERAGMEIGSHTVSHRELPRLSASERRAELRDSKRLLERRLRHPVYWFCYPIGRFDDASVKAVREAGYLIAVTTQPGKTIRSARPLETPRVRIHGPGSVGQLRAALRR